MKNLKFVLFLLLSVIIIGASCTPTNTPEGNPPVITVRGPNQGSVFTIDSRIGEVVVVCAADAEDESSLTRAAVTITNSSNNVEVSSYERPLNGNSPSPGSLYESLKIYEPGAYRVKFEWEDTHGNIGEATRDIICNPLEIDEETDA